MSNEVEIVDDLPVAVEGYDPTRAERKLFPVLFDPKHMNSSISEICKIANVSRETYYQSIKKKGFVDTIKAYAIDATKGKAVKYVHLLERFAEEGSFAHLRVLLSMSGLYDDKFVVELEPVKTLIQPRAYKGE